MALDLVGIAEVSTRLDIPRNTLKAWRSRGTLPEERWNVSGSPIWDWDRDIVPWARETLSEEHYQIP